MATYRTALRTDRGRDEVFAYMADLRNFAEWDPGVTAVDQVAGEGAGPDSVYDVRLKAGPREMELRYETVDYDPPQRILVRAESSLMVSLDEITVESSGGATLVRYEADLTLKGPLRLADPLLGLAFGRIGDRAAAGLRDALDGVEVET